MNGTLLAAAAASKAADTLEPPKDSESPDEVVIELTTKLIGLYKTPEAAKKAVGLMSARGIPEEQTSLLRPDDSTGPRLAAYASHQASRFAVFGALGWGAFLAAVAALVAVSGADVAGTGATPLWIPALAGLGAGMPLGGLAGALYGWRQPVLRADFFDPDARHGGTALGVYAKTEEELAAARFALRATGALQVRSQSA